MKVAAGGSASVVENVPTTVPTGWFSATSALDNASAVGDRFTSVTSIVKDSSYHKPPESVVRTRIE